MTEGDDQNSDDGHTNNATLYEMVKKKSQKIDLLKIGQQEILNQLRLLTEKLVGITLAKEDMNQSFNNENYLEKSITSKEMSKMLSQAKAAGGLKKKAHAPKISIENGPSPYPTKAPILQSYCCTSSAYQDLIHFNTVAGGISGVVNNDVLKI